MKNTLRYILLPTVALLIIISLASWLSSNFAQKSTSSTGEALIGGSFSLTNQYGATITDKDFRGDLMLVYFGFTNCPMICPADMAKMTIALEELGDKAVEVTPIFITIDPERDNVEQIKSFSENFYPTLQALTGTPEQIADVANVYHIYYKQVKSDELQEYTMDHSAFMYLMGRDGKYLTHFTHNQKAGDIAAGVKKYL